MSNILQIIKNPRYEVDLSRYCQPAESPQEINISTANVVKKIFYGLGLLFGAFYMATLETGRQAGTSFKYTVLGGQDRSRLDLRPHVIVMRIFFWALCLGASIFIEAQRRLSVLTLEEQRTALPMESGIDLGHLRTSEIVLDTTQVPAEVKVRDLLQIFNSINFQKSNEPGYMPPTTRIEENNNFSVARLETFLATFVRRVETREPFLGTPSAYDIPRLMAFYQQIEDAVRLCINKVNSELKNFQTVNGTQINKYDKKQLQTYSELLTMRARLAIDLAIAGNHCGARYMGDTMNAYQCLLGISHIANSLEEHLIELLAQKRREIALKEIGEHLSADAHEYTAYLAYFGTLLALPGTKNIVETLADLSLEDRKKLTASFFKKYDSNCIIETIQQEVKKSQILREQIIDWLSDQVNDWNKAETENEMQQALNEMQADLSKPLPQENETCKLYKCFIDLIAELKKKHINWEKLPNLDTEWKPFVEELLARDDSKEFLNSTFASWGSNDTSVLPLAMKNKLKMQLYSVAEDKDLLASMKLYIRENQAIDNVLINNAINLKAKLKSMQKYMTGLPEESLKRIASGQADLKPLLERYWQRQRSSHFLGKLNLEKINSLGLPPQILEWLLVSHAIFKPQHVSTNCLGAMPRPPQAYCNRMREHLIHALSKHLLPNLKSSEKKDLINKCAQWLINVFDENFSKPEDIELRAKEFLNKSGNQPKRYCSDHKTELLRTLFEKSFTKQPEAHLALAKAHSNCPQLDWKKVALLHTSGLLCDCLDYKIFKVGVSLVASLGAGMLMMHILVQIQNCFRDEIYPLAIRPLAFCLFGAMCQLRSFVKELIKENLDKSIVNFINHYGFEILICLIVSVIMGGLIEIWLRPEEAQRRCREAERRVAAHEGQESELLNIVGHAAVNTYNWLSQTMNNLCERLHIYSTHLQTESLNLRKKHCYALLLAATRK